jgi:hypothetical protein
VSDTIILAFLSALNLVAVTVVSVVSHDIPGILTTTLTTLIGATAGVAVTNRSTAGSAIPSPIPDAAIG